MLRPSLHDPKILRPAAEALMPRLFGIEPSDEVLDDLVGALTRTAPDFDGYEMAEYLKRQTWEVDGELVENLNMAFTEVLYVHENAVQAWVVQENIVARRAVNDEVTLKVKGVLHTGRIVRIDARNATYVVAIAALGHGVSDAWGNRTNGLVIPFEDLHTILTPAEEFELVMQ